MQLLVRKPIVYLNQFRIFVPRHQSVFLHIIVTRQTHIVAVINNFKHITAVSGCGNIGVLTMTFGAGKILSIHLKMNTLPKFLINPFKMVTGKRLVATMTIEAGSQRFELQVCLVRINTVIVRMAIGTIEHLVHTFGHCNCVENVIGVHQSFLICSNHFIIIGIGLIGMALQALVMLCILIILGGRNNWKAIDNY